MRNFIASLRCIANGDEVEDVAGGLDKALKLNWKSNNKVAVLICDWPTHGTKYHTGHYDRYPKGNPDGHILENQMKEFSSRRINFTIIKYTDYVKKMIKVMQENYDTKD